MRKTFLAALLPVTLFILLPMLFGCKGNKAEEPSVADSDTVALDTAKADSMESIISEAPMPKTADELFDDFIFNFAANRKLQKKRIQFPLPVLTNGKQTSLIQLGHWKMEHFFMRQGYYTLIFDNMKQMKLVKDTSVNHVVIEKIFFSKKQVKQFIFERKNGQWMMTSINNKPSASPPTVSSRLRA